MKTKAVLLMLLFSFSGLSSAAAPDPNLPPLEYCRSWLSAAAKADIPYQKWAVLPDALSSVAQATVLVRLDLEKQFPSLDYLDFLSTEENGLNIPPPLRTVFNNQFIFIANGRLKDLLRLHKRIAESPAASAASFRILDIDSQFAKIETPKISIEINGDLEKSEASITEKISQGQSFGVVNVPARQAVYFLPRASVDKYLVALREEGVKVVSPRGPFSNWSKWLVNKTVTFDTKALSLARGWVVLSSSAFTTLLALSREFTGSFNGAPSSTAGLVQALNQCYDINCRPPEPAVQPQALLLLPPPTASAAEPAAILAEEADRDLRHTFTQAAQDKIIEYFTKNRGNYRLSDPGSVRKIALALAKKIPDKRAADDYRAEVWEIPFGKYEHQLWRKDGPGRERFVRWWRAYLKGMGVEYATRTLDYRNVMQALHALELKTQPTERTYAEDDDDSD
jgi:hypothetical protein